MSYIPPGAQKQPPKPGSSKDPVSGVNPREEPELVGPPEPGASDIVLTGTYVSESIEIILNQVAAQENPCDAVGVFFEALADQIDQLAEAFDELVDLLVDKISNFLGIPAIIVRWVVDYALIKLGLKKDFQSEEVFKNAAGIGSGGGGEQGCNTFTDELRALYQLGLDSAAFLQEAERMKRKWGGYDPSLDEILDDPSGWLRDLGADFERLCNMIPQYECDKKGGVKVTVAKHGLGFPIPLIEILEEGVSPWILKLLDALAELDFKGLEAHEHYDKIKDEADGYWSWGDL
jgi:hypothetical protein